MQQGIPQSIQEIRASETVCFVAEKWWDNWTDKNSETMKSISKISLNFFYFCIIFPRFHFFFSGTKRGFRVFTWSETITFFHFLLHVVFTCFLYVSHWGKMISKPRGLGALLISNASVTLALLERETPRLAT
jgi:hypothetical protein